MDVDMNTNDYNINQIEETAAIYEHQQVDYKADYLKNYLKLVGQIKENGDGTKTLKIQNINEVTPELIDKIEAEKDIDNVYLGTEINYGKYLGRYDTYNVDEIKICIEKLDELVGDLRNNDKLSELEKVMLVAKRISEGVTYDDDLVEKEDNKTATTKEKIDARNLMGALAKGKTVCAGYASVFCAAMNALDIPSKSIGGNVIKSNGEEVLHGWNQVQIDGKWYNLDITDLDCMNEEYIQDLKNDNKQIYAGDYLYGDSFLESDEEFNIKHLDEKEENNLKEEFKEKVRNNQKGQETIVPYYSVYDEEVEECTSTISQEERDKAIKNIEEYEASLELDKEVNSSGLTKETNLDSQKISIFQKIKNFFSKNNKNLALPEPVSKIVGETSNEQRETISSQGNDFRSSLKISENSVLNNNSIEQDSESLESADKRKEEKNELDYR